MKKPKKKILKSKVYQSKLAEIDLEKELKDFEGFEVKVSIELSKAKRSNPDNAYLFGVIYPNLLQGLIDADPDYSVLTIDDIHEWSKQKFKKILKPKTKEIIDFETGEAITIERTTTVTDEVNFQKYKAAIIDFCILYLNVPYQNFKSKD